MTPPFHSLVSACEAEGNPTRKAGTDAIPCGPSDAAHGSPSVRDVTDPTLAKAGAICRVPSSEQNFSNGRPKPQTFWTQDETVRLADLAQAGTSCREIARILKRSDSSISDKAKRIGIRFLSKPQWSCDEIAVLCAILAKGQSSGEAAKALDRTRNETISKAKRLGLRFHSQQGTRKGKPPRKQRNHERIVPTVKLRAYPLRPDAPPPETAVTFMQVGPYKQACRWPYGDPRTIEAFRYCNLPSNDRVYCEGHRELARSKGGAS